jgi:hypothetical protein
MVPPAVCGLNFIYCFHVIIYCTCRWLLLQYGVDLMLFLCAESPPRCRLQVDFRIV